MHTGPTQSLYNRYILEYRPLPTTEAKRLWLLKTFPFWSIDGVFDVDKFIHWHQNAHFIDQETWFRELKLDEQKMVLRIWASQTQLNFTPQLAATSIQTSTEKGSNIPKFLPELTGIRKLNI
jgi:hypothetical protein